MRPGGPPRSPELGSSTERSRGGPGHVQFDNCQQIRTRNIRPPSPRPSEPSAGRGFGRPRRCDSPRRDWPPTLPRCEGRHWLSLRPLSPESRGPASRGPTPSVGRSHASPVEKSRAFSAERSHASPCERRPVFPTERSHASPCERSHASPVERSHASPVERSHASPSERSHASPCERSHASPSERSHASPVEKSRASPVERSRTAHAERSHASSAERSRASPFERGRTAHAERSHASSAERSRVYPAERGHVSPSERSRASPTERGHASPAQKSRGSTAVPPCPPQQQARGAVEGGVSLRMKALAQKEVLPVQRAYKMAAPMELFCWSGGWGLPSVDLDSLTVLTYTRFTGAPLKVHKITNPWRSPSGTLPALRTSQGEVISAPQKIITHLRKEKYNADYDLSARQGADTLAFMSLLEEKLLPVLIHTFWIDTKNYVEVTRKWYAEAMPFPLNFFLPGRMQRQYMERLQLTNGKPSPENEEEVEKELYQEARECLTLLSQRLGSQKFFFGDAPASLDAFVFSHLALLLQVKMPSGKLQIHLRGLQNLCAYCSHILSLYFPWDGAAVPPPRQTPAAPDTEEEPNRRRNQILSVLAGLVAMVGYALLSGIISIQRAAPPHTPGTRALDMVEEDEEE
ncbi:metaxin-1 isoform X2 [Dipodomys merriami]|uniref:metaxin-1 isoform X2 n=1 Tax=Dipodomys merriami TaxID=94247 RepID=UPI0038557C86